MRPFRPSVLLLAVGFPGIVLGYSGVADVTLAWGVGGTAISWSSTTQNALAVVSNDSRFTAVAGSNLNSYFNPDFVASSNYDSGTADDCLTSLPGYDTIVLRKYGCRQLDATGSSLPVFHRSPPTDAGPAAAAVGTLSFTDTTLTGTLAVVATTDEPTGGDESSVGNGASAFNLRVLDTSVFGNAWYGVSIGATLTVDLTGEFTAAGWEITGGTVRLSDPAFQCQQGGIGGQSPDYVLCQVSAVPGGFSADGSNLGFGIDADGGGAGTAMTEVLVRDASGAVVASLGGVLASVTVTAGGALATDFGEYRSGAGISSGGCLGQIRWDGSKITCGTLTAGALQITGTATPVDTEPDPFSFTDASDVPVGTVATSTAVTISGIAAPSRITVSGGQYSIDCTGDFTSAAGNIMDGSTVCLRHTSSASPGTDTVTTLNVGGITGTFTSTTVPADTAPAAFAFTDQAGVSVSAEVVSAAITITGINSAAPVSVSGGEYSVGCGGLFTSVGGSINPGQTVCVRHTSAATPLTATATTLTVGGVSAAFTSTTVAAAPPDTTPDPFAFVDRNDVALNVPVVSPSVTITGITAAAPVSVTGGDYSIDCTGTFVTMAGSIANNQMICVRQTSAAGYSAATSTTLTVGGVAGTFTSTTVAVVPPDTTPNTFAFTDQAGVALSAVITSAAVAITGIDAPVAISVTGGEYSIGCAAGFTTAPGSISENELVCIRHTSAGANSTQTSTTLTVGGVSNTFTSTTVAAGGDGGGGGGGGAVDWWVPGILAGLPLLRQRRSSLALRRPRQ